MSRSDVVPEVLWTPSPERVARAAISDFSAFVGDRTGREVPDYAALWTFSTEDLSGSGRPSPTTSGSGGTSHPTRCCRRR